MPTKDKRALLEMPGAMVRAGTANKQVKASREAFRVSVGRGSASGGSGQLDGTGGSGDPTISYPVGPGRPRPMGRAGKAGTPEHVGKRPVNYDEDLSAYMLDY